MHLLTSEDILPIHYDLRENPHLKTPLAISAVYFDFRSLKRV